MSYTYRRGRAKFIDAETEEELTMLSERNPKVGKAVVKLRELSADERTRDLYERREKARRDQAIHQKWAVKQSKIEIAGNWYSRERTLRNTALPRHFSIIVEARTSVSFSTFITAIPECPESMSPMLRRRCSREVDARPSPITTRTASLYRLSGAKKAGFDQRKAERIMNEVKKAVEGANLTKEVIAKPPALPGTRASCPHLSRICGRAARVPRGFAITS